VIVAAARSRLAPPEPEPEPATPEPEPVVAPPAPEPARPHPDDVPGGWIAGRDQAPAAADVHGDDELMQRLARALQTELSRRTGDS
jgi:hypothetical protein